jgi:dTDP-4-dehydrorhamnose reductase
MLKLMNSRDEIGVVGDQVGSPTWAHDLAEALLVVIQDPERKTGIYHFTNEGITNWHTFATAIYEEGINAHILTKPCRIKKLTTSKYPTKTKRPAYSVLSKAKIAKDFGITIPEWRTSLSLFIQMIAHKPEVLSARSIR